MSAQSSRSSGTRRGRIMVSLAATSMMLGVGAGVANAAAFSVGKFSPWSGYGILNGTWLTGDFDGNGKMDLLHAVNATDYVHVWRSRGDGNFDVSTFRPWSGYGISNGIWMTGDFNGDGKTDVVHAVRATDYVHVWTSNGNGTFSVGTFRPWAGYGIPNGVWMTGDFNGDKKTDLVHLVNGTDYAHIWTSNGNGTFSVGTFRPWAGYGIPNGVWTAGDFNGDGKTDLLHAVSNTDYAHVWTSNGNGTFSVGTFRPWPGYGITNGQLLVGDFNGDGRSDVVHAVNNTDYVHVWTSNGSGSFSVGTFRPWAGYGIPNGVWQAGDFDRDGKADIVHAVAGTDYAHIWRSRGNATFNVTTFSPWSGYGIPNGVWLTADFTGDGRADLVHLVNNTDYVHVWRSTLPAPGEVSVDGLEISQAIQDMRQTVGLVADKATWVRAYLSANVSSPVTVRGTLTVARVGGSTTTVSSINTVSINPAQNDQIRPKRENLVAGLNFVLPAAATSSSGLGLSIVSLATVTKTATGTTLTCSDCATSPRLALFRQGVPLRARVIGLSYRAGSPATTVAPRVLDFALIRSWLRRAYPVAQVQMTQTTVPSTNDWPFDCGAANAQVSAIRALDVAGGTDARTHYFGLVADTAPGGFMRGCAAVPGSADPAAIGSGPTGSGNWSWDFDGSYGDWYTGHELGHTFGRAHPGSGCGESSDDSSYPYPAGQLADADGAFVGLDTGDSTNGIPASVLPGPTWHDVMTYCQREWLSAYTYEGIRNRLQAENGTAPGASGPPLAAPLPSPGAPGMLVATLPPRGSAGTSSAAASPPAASTALPAPPAVSTALLAPPVARLALDAPPATPAPAAAKKPVIRSATASKPKGVVSAAMKAPPAIQRGQLPEPNATDAGETPLKLQVKGGDFLSVVATVNLTKHTAKIRHVNRLDRAQTATSPADGRASVRLLDSNGKVLITERVSIKQDSDIPADKDKTGLIDAIVPFTPGATKVEVLLDEKVVDSFSARAGKPEIRELRFPTVLKRVAPGAAPPVLQWEARDPDGDKLTYNVQISSDEGKSWQTLAIGLSSPAYTPDPSQLPAGKVMVRIIATDGFSSVVKSQTITTD